MNKLFTLLLLLSSWNAWAQTPAVRVLVNGEPIVFNTTTPENRNGYVMVPANQVFTRLNFTISYNPATLRVTATKPKPGGNGTYSVSFTNGDPNVVVNGVAQTLPAEQIPYFKDGYSMVPVRLVSEAANCRTDFDLETQSVQVYYYDELEAGLYFIGKQDDTQTDQAGAQKFTPGVANPFYDPAKPTIIYVHGAQPGAVAAKTREDLIFKATGKSTQNPWIDRGWNVAIFHWVQLADDANGLLPSNAEYKMYGTAAGNGLPGTRWRRSDNTFSSTNWSKTVTDIFLDEYAELIPNSSTALPEIELVGNSLGGQLVMTAVAKMKFVRGYQPASSTGALLNRMPQRLTLMDPYWTDAKASNHRGTTFDPARPGASFIETFGDRDLKQAVGIMVKTSSSGQSVRDIPITYYRTSSLGLQGTSATLTEQTAFLELKPEYVGPSSGFLDFDNPIKRHTWPVRAYFASVGCGTGRNGGLEVNSSGTATRNETGRTGPYRASTNTCGPAPTTGNQVGGALLSSTAIKAMMTLYSTTSSSGTFLRTRSWQQQSSTNTNMNALRYTVSVPAGSTPAPRLALPTATATPLAGVSLSPNPTAGPVLIAYTLPTVGTVQVQVNDLLGRSCFTQTGSTAEAAGAHTLRADLSALPIGPYVLTFFVNGSKVQTQKFLKAE